MSIQIPKDYSEKADIIKDLKIMAESIQNEFNSDRATINALIAENQSYKNQIPKGTASGDSITLSDSSNLPIESIVIKGKTSQETREGYNLFDKNTNIATSKYFGTSGEILAASAEDNYLQEEYIEVKANTNYFLSTATYIRVCEYDSEKNFIKISNSTTSNSLTITTSDTTKYIRVSFVGSLDTFQITEGTEEKEFEKYGATPSIDFPSPIKCIKGENEVKFQNKNLLNLNQTWANGYINSTGVFTSSNNNYLSDYINVNSDTIYILSVNRTIAGVSVAEFDEKKNFITRKTISNNSINNFTTSNKSKYIRVWFIKDTSTMTLAILQTLEPQLEKEISRSDYIEHQEQVYPISLSDIELYENGYINIEYEETAGYKNITKASVVNSYFKGNYPITRSMCGSREVQGFYFKISDIASDSKIKSSHQKEIKTSNYNTDEDWQKYDGNTIGHLYPTVNKGAIYINAPADITEIDNFVTWWNELNPEIYYKFKTSTETEITDSTLIAQLEALINAETYKNVTHINTTAEGLKPEVKLVYKKDLETMFNNLNTAVIAIGGV